MKLGFLIGGACYLMRYPTWRGILIGAFCMALAWGIKG